MKKKKTVTLPRSFDPGKGHPKETLAYLSPAEHELIRQLTDGKWNRGPKGVRSYADDSASSKGVSRGDSSGTRGSGGLGQGGQNNAGSRASSSPSGGVSTGGRTPSGSGGSSAPAGAGGQRGAGSNYGPGSGRPSGLGGGMSLGGGSAFGGVSRAAQSNAMSAPVSMSGALDGGYYHSGFSTGARTLPGMNNPTQFDRTIRPTGMVNAAHIPMDTFSNGYNPNALTPGAQKIHQAVVDNALRTNTPVDFFSGKSGRTAGTQQHPLGEALDVRLKDPVTGAFVGTPQIGAAFARNPIGNVNYAKGRTPQVASAIQSAIGAPYRQFATGVMNSFMDNPGVYGDFNNQRWGGSFGGRFGKDYMHYDEGKVTSGVSADQAALRREAANYGGPNTTSMLASIDGPIRQPQGASVFSQDRPPVTPLGAIPAASPPKDIQLAWNMPPMGGAIGAGASARPAAAVETISDAPTSGSWLDSVKTAATNMGLDPNKIITVGTDAVQQLADGNKKVAAAQQTPWGRLGLTLMGAGGTRPATSLNSAFGTPQDRSGGYRPPQPMPQPVARPSQPVQPSTDPLQTLMSLQQNMIAKGAKPEELAYIQSLIDELSSAQVA